MREHRARQHTRGVLRRTRAIARPGIEERSRGSAAARLVDYPRHCLPSDPALLRRARVQRLRRSACGSAHILKLKLNDRRSKRNHCLHAYRFDAEIDPRCINHLLAASSNKTVAEPHRCDRNAGRRARTTGNHCDWKRQMPAEPDRAGRDHDEGIALRDSGYGSPHTRRRHARRTLGAERPRDQHAPDHSNKKQRGPPCALLCNWTDPPRVGLDHLDIVLASSISPRGLSSNP